jgi:hypothetical protein
MPISNPSTRLWAVRSTRSNTAQRLGSDISPPGVPPPRGDVLLPLTNSARTTPHLHLLRHRGRLRRPAHRSHRPGLPRIARRRPNFPRTSRRQPVLPRATGPGPPSPSLHAPSPPVLAPSPLRRPRPPRGRSLLCSGILTRPPRRCGPDAESPVVDPSP